MTDDLTRFRERLLVATSGADSFIVGADAVLAALDPVGVDYCTKHNGLRNEDEYYCDERDHTGDCPDCLGDGGCEADDDDVVEWVECASCEGDGRTTCALTPLYHIAPPPRQVTSDG